MKKLFPFLVRLKYRYDIGGGFLNVLSFLLLLVATAEKLQGFLGISKARYFVIICAVAGLSGVWLVGYILDRYVKIVELYNREANARNEDLQAIKRNVTAPTADVRKHLCARCADLDRADFMRMVYMLPSGNYECPKCGVCFTAERLEAAS